MDSRNTMLGELASSASLERREFLVQAAAQLQRFIDDNAGRIAELGGLTLIDEDPDYLSIAPDLTFRSRTRYFDDETGEWVSETEVIESAGELVELYNASDVFAAFAEAARDEAGLGPEPTGAEDLYPTAGIAPEETIALEAEPVASTEAALPTTQDEAVQRLYDLTLTFVERSQRTEARLFDDFQGAAAPFTFLIGEMTIVDDEDERVMIGTDGRIRAEVVPEDADGEWRMLATPDDLVEFYDPTDVFSDLADALAEAFPEVADEGAGDDAEDADDGDELADEAEDEGDEEPDGDAPDADNADDDADGEDDARA
jgi:hypothetical protein